VGVVRDLLARIRARAIGEEVHQSLTPGQQVIKIVDEELVTTLGREHVPLNKPAKPPLVILMVGLQGSGKTTTTAKLAKHLKESGRRPLLVAADLQRPAAVEQLQQLGERIGVPVYSETGSRPTRVVRSALKEATRGIHDVVLIDTAGRLQVDKDLMDELSAIRKIAEPDETLLVVDAMTGQDAVNVAQGFLEYTELTGIVLSKLDGDARGGAAISVREVTGRPIKFAAVGEGLDEFEVFHPDRMASRILGMGDLLTLMEKAEETWDEAEAERLAERMQKAEFDLDDFLKQMQQIRRMGSLQGLLAMLPGAGAALRDVDIDERDLGRVEAIIRSMTPEERRSPRIINAHRRRRVATGSGTSLQQVNQLLKQFGEAQKMMQAFAGGGMTGLPGLPGGGGLPGQPGVGRPPRRPTAQRKKNTKKRKKR
jgi:signal recognition particle subunit SRP54